MKTHDFDKFLATQLKDPGLKKAYDDLADEYDLAAQVIRFRMDRNLTQIQLARLVGTSQPAIARLESGNHKNVTLSFLFRVAKALDLKPELRFRKVKISRRSTSIVSHKTTALANKRLAKPR